MIGDLGRQILNLARQFGRMFLDRFAQQPQGARRRGDRDRPAIVTKLPLHGMRGVVDLFADPIFAAIDERRRLERRLRDIARSEEHTSELQSLMRITYAVFCLKKKHKPKKEIK